MLDCTVAPEFPEVVLGFAGPEFEVVADLREVGAGCGRDVAGDRLPCVAVTLPGTRDGDERAGRPQCGETT
ncbi:MAG: hypothetical protein J07HX64_01866 [halophilic archaeon J07HX64]|nr:MAG: hypothetical protein J07HX64_01866 [halophilic archaeon J07HX64]